MGSFQTEKETQHTYLLTSVGCRYKYKLQVALGCWIWSFIARKNPVREDTGFDISNLKILVLLMQSCVRAPSASCTDVSCMELVCSRHTKYTYSFESLDFSTF